MIITVVFWVSAILIAHSYLFYPVIIQLLASRKTKNNEVYRKTDNLPFVSILMAVHNEETVLVEKVRSIYYTLYPFSKFEVLVGSDASTDLTNKICKVYQQNYQSFRFFPFMERQGKPGVINSLEKKASGDILIITDANVFFNIDTIFNLVKHFKNKDVGLVDSVMTHSGMSKKGIAEQENTYIRREISIKQNESRLWGAMMGPFGGCYAIRKNLFTDIPENYLVDDFFINMNVIRKGKKTINSMDSAVNEDVPHNLADEFRRKVRISTGNFQNLKHYFPLALNIFRGSGFAFFSHKVIRWLGPFLLLAIFITSLFLLDKPFYRIIFAIELLIATLFLIDLLLNQMAVSFRPFRFITHFLSMNLALLIGFFRYLGGVKTGIWQPTRRNQGEQNKTSQYRRSD